MGVGGDMYRGLATMAIVGMIATLIVAAAALGGLLWLMWRGIASVLS